MCGVGATRRDVNLLSMIDDSNAWPLYGDPSFSFWRCSELEEGVGPRHFA